MFQAIQRITDKITHDKRLGQIIAIVALLLGLLLLSLVLAAKSQNYILLTGISLLIYGAVCLWISYYPGYREWVIPGMFILVILVPLIRFLIGVGGGPTTWDELLYMNAAKNSVAEIRVLNQYFHIFLLKIFYWLTNGDSFRAVRYYWIVIQSAVLTLIYLSIVLLTRKHATLIRIVCGVFGLFLFSIQPFVMEYIGVAYVDFTLELLFSICAFLVILSLTVPRFSSVSVLLLGLILGFGLRTKEVAIALLVPVAGILWIYARQHISIRTILTQVGLFILGIVLACAILIAFNAIILHDPLWGFRASDFASWYAARTGFDPGLKPIQNKNFFTALVFSPSLFSLFFIMLKYAQPKTQTEKQIYQILISFSLVFIAIYSLIPFQAYPRYLIPVYPILAILAAPFLATLFQDKTTRILWFIATIPFAAIISYVIETLILQQLDPGIYQTEFVYGVFVLPIFMVCLTLILLLVPIRATGWRVVLTGLVFFSGSLIPFNQIFSSLESHTISENVNQRFEIIKEWAPDIQSHPDRLIFASNFVRNGRAPIGLTPDYTRIMLNIALDGNLPKASVTTDLPEFLQGDYSRYCFGVLASSEYDSLGSQEKEQLAHSFSIRMSENKQQVFLTNLSCQ